MKRKYYFTVLIFLITISCYGNDICDIKKDVLEFLIKYENINNTITIDNITNSFIMEVRELEPIKKNMTGIFLFNAINFHGSYAHFLLVEKDDFQIINMRESFCNNIEKLIKFLERNAKYSKNDVLFYISTFMRIHNNNMNPTGVITTERVI